VNSKNGLDYDRRDGWQAFRDWLVSHHAALLPPLTPWEIYRAETNIGTIVGYRNRQGKANHPPNARELVDMFISKVRQPPSLAKGKIERNHQGRKTIRRIVAIMNRDGPECFYCARSLQRPYDRNPDNMALPRATVEHFLAIGMGGPDNLHNSVVACKKCNEDAGSMSIVAKIALRLARRSR